MSSLQSNQSSRDLPKILFVVHLLLTLIINFVLEKPYNFLSFLGTIAFTIGASAIVIISYILLSKHKINKTGSYIFIAVQLMASSGGFCSILVHFTPNYYILGILCGVVSNAFYVAAMLLLLSRENSSNPSPTVNKPRLETLPSNAVAKVISFCPYCGNKIASEDQKFCAYCGKTLMEQMQNNITPPSTAPLTTENQVKETKTRIDFTEGEKLDETPIKKKLHYGQKVLTLGKIEFNGFAFIPRISTVATWIIEFLLVALTYDDGRPSSISSSGKVVTVGNRYHLLLGINIAKEPIPSGEISYLWDNIFLVALVCLLLLAIPVIVMWLIKRRALDTELVLTDGGIHISRNGDHTIITLHEIENIEYAPCPLFLNANKLSITTKFGQKTTVYGVTNAPEFAKKALEASKSHIK